MTRIALEAGDEPLLNAQGQRENGLTGQRCVICPGAISLEPTREQVSPYPRMHVTPECPDLAIDA